MKQLYLKQQVFSITNQFKVYDELQKVIMIAKVNFYPFVAKSKYIGQLIKF
jgi:uncharacterized protein YxjI